MHRLAFALFVLASGCTPRPAATPAESASAVARTPATTVTEWSQAFAAEGGRGVFVLLDPATGRMRTSDPERAARRFLPASTFKLYNALVALDAGVVTDVDSVWVWDGVQRSIPAWNRDHTLRSGMAASTVWLYQRLATRVGRDRYVAAFAREPYGNRVMGDSLRWFWLDNSLQISANEEVAFVDRLRTGTTGFSDAAEVTVRGIVPVLTERTGTHGPVRIVAKTGWGGDAEMGIADIGWIVGWVERAEADGGPVVFALNVEDDPESAAPFDMGPARLRIAEAILTAESILPSAR
ncbi:MAG TPA: penicillin-binding transpeptidase domain-containing protein [Rubricoccaceae bacterium]|jgi:beta-lactamase class D